MEQSISENDVINKLKDKLVGSGWESILNPFLDSNEFYKITSTLIQNHQNNLRFTPKYFDILNAFIESPYDKTKVVILGQDPYPQLGVADGIAFSCSNKNKAEKSLQYIFKALYGTYEDKDYDLKRWSNQGVLLINTAFTCQINKIGSHFHLWQPFTNYLFKYLNENNKLIFALMGKKAEIWETKLSNQILLKCPHPASAAYKGGIWDSKDIFNNINLELNKLNKTKINW